MRSRWWSWISAVLAVLCGLAFGWVAGSGLVRAAALVPAYPVAAASACHGVGHGRTGRVSAEVGFEPGLHAPPAVLGLVLARRDISAAVRGGL